MKNTSFKGIFLIIAGGFTIYFLLSSPANDTILMLYLIGQTINFWGFLIINVLLKKLP